MDRMKKRDRERLRTKNDTRRAFVFLFSSSNPHYVINKLKHFLPINGNSTDGEKVRNGKNPLSLLCS